MIKIGGIRVQKAICLMSKIEPVIYGWVYVRQHTSFPSEYNAEYDLYLFDFIITMQSLMRRYTYNSTTTQVWKLCE